MLNEGALRQLLQRRAASLLKLVLQGIILDSAKSANELLVQLSNMITNNNCQIIIRQLHLRDVSAAVFKQAS